MTDYDEDDDLDNEEAQASEPAEEQAAAAAAAGSNRNFLLALGVLGGIFVLLIIGLAILFLTRRQGAATNTANINATNQVILMANTQTAGAATSAAALLLTPSATTASTKTSVPPTATNTQVVAIAQPTATGGSGANPAQIFTVTPNIQTRTATIGAALTQSAQQTLTRTAGPQGPGAEQTLSAQQTLTSRAAQTLSARQTITYAGTKLPTTGFAEDAGLPGLFGLAVVLVLVIFLVRRLRLTTSR